MERGMINLGMPTRERTYPYARISINRDIPIQAYAYISGSHKNISPYIGRSLYRDTLIYIYIYVYSCKGILPIYKDIPIQGQYPYVYRYIYIYIYRYPKQGYPYIGMPLFRNLPNRDTPILYRCLHIIYIYIYLYIDIPIQVFPYIGLSRYRDIPIQGSPYICIHIERFCFQGYPCFEVSLHLGIPAYG